MLAQRSEFVTSVSPHDDMLIDATAGAMTHYLSVGRSAADVVARALQAAGNPPVRSVLDLPCGGGRVTRHLCHLFPDSEIFVSDLNKDKEDYVLGAMPTKRAEANPEFRNPPERQYDLIFVGSLLTHFRASKCRRATDWFISALAPGGVLVLTLHGRRHNNVHLSRTKFISRSRLRWLRAMVGYTLFGFGYAPYPGSPDYGLSISTPAWATRLIMRRSDAKIVSFQEAAWDNYQDVLVVQKADLQS